MNIYNPRRLGVLFQYRTFSAPNTYSSDSDILQQSSSRLTMSSDSLSRNIFTSQLESTYTTPRHNQPYSSVLSSTACLPSVSTALQCQQRRTFVNEETYIRRGTLTREQQAREALLQYNIMIHRGIKPNVVTFTSLISVMGSANMEWQAYRLFSQMLEQGITPIPETYVALKRATKRTRKKLIQDIEEKLAAVSETMPNTLAIEVTQLLKEDAEKEEAEFLEYFRKAEKAIDEERRKEISSTSMSNNNGEESPEQFSEGHMLFDDDGSSSYADGERANAEGQHISGRETKEGTPYSTVHIEHPINVWGVHKRLSESSDSSENRKANAEEYNNLSIQLNKMHEEELRVFLSYNRQLRHGDKVSLISRVLQYIPVQVIDKMLRARSKYFRAVEQAAKMQLDALRRGSNLDEDDDAVKDVATKMKRGTNTTNTTNTTTKGKDSRLDTIEEENQDILMEMYNNAAEQDVIDNSEKEEDVQPTLRSYVKSDVQLSSRETDVSTSVNQDPPSTQIGLPKETPLERYIKSPPFIYTPWGAIRKPLKGPEPLVKLPNISAKRSISRAELEIVFEKATTGEVEAIPTRVLRSYAAEFGLTWKRYHPDSLSHAVVHHANNVLPGLMLSSNEGVVEQTPTLSGRFRAIVEEKQGAQKTLEDYEAFRIISKRTKNLQVTDSRDEVNTSLHQAQRVSKVTEIKIDQQQRKERHMSAMEALRRGAVEYKKSSFDYSSLLKEEEERRNIGIKRGETYMIGAHSGTYAEATKGAGNTSRVILGNDSDDKNKNDNSNNNNNNWKSSQDNDVEDPLCADSRRLLKLREKYPDLKIQPNEVEDLDYIEKLNENANILGNSKMGKITTESGKVINTWRMEESQNRENKDSKDGTRSHVSLTRDEQAALLKSSYSTTSSAASAASAAARGPQELPPWALDSASLPFNIDTGRFGSPTVGQYMELADGRVRLMPRHEASNIYTVSANLLPSEDRKEIIRHKAFSEVDKVRRTALDDEKVQFKRYRNLRNHIGSMKEYDRERRRENRKVILRPPERVSSHLRKDRIYQRIDVTDERIRRFSNKH